MSSTGTVRVFCDFDGTIATSDVGDELFREFAGTKATEIVQQYYDGDITARECLTMECETVDHCTSEELEAFIERFAVDEHFGSFVEMCAARKIPLVVLSDGLDFYVEGILERHGFGHLASYANHVEFVVEGSQSKLRPSFPYTDSECQWCGNCKRNHLLTLSADEDVIVYIGDGLSDRCPVRYADIVFAKSSLIKHCQAQNISYFEYDHFGDVRERLENLLEQKRFRKRREAAMARRDVFMQG